MRLACLLVLTLVVGCAKAAEIENANDAGESEIDSAADAIADDVGTDTSTGGDASVPDTATTDAPAADSAMNDGPAADAPNADAPSVDGGPCGLVINEVQTGTGGSGAEDFIELHNTCATETPSLAGWTVGYRGGSTTQDTLLYTFPSGARIAASGYFVLGSAAFSGASDGQLGSGLASDGGAIALRDGSENRIDSVAYGNSSSVLKETTKALAPGETSKSLSRVPNGIDTNNNASDFSVTNPTPGAANAP